MAGSLLADIDGMKTESKQQYRTLIGLKNQKSTQQ